MPGCGCAGSSCGCKVEAGLGITVTGTGTKADPYVLQAKINSINSVVTFQDSATVDFTVVGAGTPTDPMVVSATAPRQPFPAYVTAGRPDASLIPAGSYYYDSTLKKPGWSDGAVWRDAAGVAIPA